MSTPSPLGAGTIVALAGGRTGGITEIEYIDPYGYRYQVVIGGVPTGDEAAIGTTVWAWQWEVRTT